MGETAEEVAALDGITRAESDAFALRSHERAIAAIDAGRFAARDRARAGADGEVTTDEIPRRGYHPGEAGRAAPVFRTGGVVTAGSSSPLSDGAAALVVASEAAVERYGLTPRARIVTAPAPASPPHADGPGPGAGHREGAGPRRLAVPATWTPSS